MSKSPANADRKRQIWLSVGLIGMLCAGAYFYLPRQRVQLDPHGYEVTLALYRVCNQRNIEALTALEQKLDSRNDTVDSQCSPTSSSATNPAIREIIEMAKANQWTEATRRCRDLLDDQVQH